MRKYLKIPLCFISQQKKKHDKDGVESCLQVMMIWFNLGAECMNLTLACHWRSCVVAKYQVNYFAFE